MFFFKRKVQEIKTPEPAPLAPPDPEPLSDAVRSELNIPQDSGTLSFRAVLEVGQLFQNNGLPALLPLDKGLTTFGNHSFPLSLQKLYGDPYELFYSNDGVVYIWAKSAYDTYLNRTLLDHTQWVPVPDNGRISFDLSSIHFKVRYFPIANSIHPLEKAPLRPVLELGPIFQKFYPARFPLKEGTVSFGRADNCTIRLLASFVSGLPTEGLSRRHCELYYYTDGIYIRDTGSSYGTFLNGTMLPCNTWVPVPDHAEILLGSKKLNFTVHYRMEDAADHKEDSFVRTDI